MMTAGKKKRNTGGRGRGTKTWLSGLMGAKKGKRGPSAGQKGTYSKAGRGKKLR